MLENDMIHVLVVKPRRGVESTGRWWSVAEPLLCVVQGKQSAKGTTDKQEYISVTPSGFYYWPCT